MPVPWAQNAPTSAGDTPAIPRAAASARTRPAPSPDGPVMWFASFDIPHPEIRASGSRPCAAAVFASASRIAAAPSPMHIPSRATSKGRHRVGVRALRTENPATTKSVTTSPPQTRAQPYSPRAIFCAAIAMPTVEEAQAALISNPRGGMPRVSAAHRR